MDDFVNRQEVIDKLTNWESGEYAKPIRIFELYGNSLCGKTAIAVKAAEKAKSEGKLGRDEFIKIEFPPGTDLTKFLELMNDKFPNIGLTEHNYMDMKHLKDYLNASFSNTMLFFDNTENINRKFIGDFSKWVIKSLNPAISDLRFKRVVLAGRVPLDGYPALFHYGMKLPAQTYIGPIEHEFVEELISKHKKVDHKTIPFNLLRDMKFATAGIPKALKDIISEFDEIPESLSDNTISQTIEGYIGLLKDKMLERGLDESMFEAISTKLFSVRSFDEISLFSRVFGMNEREVRELREKLYISRFIVKSLLKSPSWHYKRYLTDPIMRWFLSAHAIRKSPEKFVEIEEKLLILYGERFSSSVKSNDIDEALKNFCEWLYHFFLLETFKNYPPDKEKFLENLERKANGLIWENSTIDLRGWRYGGYFKDECSKDELWWFVALMAKDSSDKLYNEINEIINKVLHLR